MARIIKGFIIPWYNPANHEYVDALDVTNEVGEIWHKLLHKYLSKALGYLNTYYESLKKLDLESIVRDKYRLITDIIVWLLRAPLFQDPVENVVVSPYKLYIILRLAPPELLEAIFGRAGKISMDEPLELLYTILETAHNFGQWKCEEKSEQNVEKVFRQIACLLKMVDDEEFRDLVEKALVLTPADTRPGFNTVNLITHMILVSAATWALGGTSKEVLAGLLHDIGKPLDPEHHVKKSVEEAEKLLANVDEILTRADIDEILSLIRKHHVKGNIIERADKIVVEERSKELVERVLLEDLREIIRKIVSEKGLEEYRGYENKPISIYELSGEPGWEFWKNLSVNELLDLTTKFVRRVREEAFTFKLEDSGKITPDIKVALLDFRGIQKAIRRTDELKIMIATSYTIDFMVTAYTPFLLGTSLDMPLSAIIYNAGGTLLIILPDTLKQKFEEKMKWLTRVLENKLDMSLVYAVESFNPNYTTLTQELGARIAYEKTISNRPEIELYSYQKPCEICGTKPAIETDMLGRKICEIDKKLTKIGDLLHFKTKLGLYSNIPYKGITVTLDTEHFSFSKLYDMEKTRLYDEVSSKLIEYYSGQDPGEELERQLNYSILSVDGNLMGAFMLSSTSFSDAVERSARIDLALKKALKNSLNMILKVVMDACINNTGNNVNECRRLAAREVIRLYSGILYMGGDDGRFILPSWASIPFALSLATWFYHYMGGYATLSMGLAVAPPKHSVWGLIETSSMLEDKAKPEGRKLSLSKWLKNTDLGIGSIGFILTESTSMLTPSKTEYLLNEVGRDKLGISAQPYIIYMDKEKGLNQLLSKLITVFEDDYENAQKLEYMSEIPDHLRTVLGLSYNIAKIGYLCAYMSKKVKESINESGKERINVLKDARRIINELIEAYNRAYSKLSQTPLVEAKILTLIYAKRQAARSNGRVKQFYEDIVRVSFDVSRQKGGGEDIKDLIIPLHDLYLLVKIIGGGTI